MKFEIFGAIYRRVQTRSRDVLDVRFLAARVTAIV